MRSTGSCRCGTATLGKEQLTQAHSCPAAWPGPSKRALRADDSSFGVRPARSGFIAIPGHERPMARAGRRKFRLGLPEKFEPWTNNKKKKSTQKKHKKNAAKTYEKTSTCMKDIGNNNVENDKREDGDKTGKKTTRKKTTKNNKKKDGQES